MTFPGSGFTGPTGALSYMFFANPAASGGANLGVNATGGTAAIAGSSTFTLAPGATQAFASPGLPNNVSIIASTASTPYVCYYR